MILDAIIEASINSELWSERYERSFAPRYLNWHPIVLEEIAMKDFTTDENSTTREYLGIRCMTELDAGLQQQIRYVPLPPTETGRYRRDPRHTELKGPKFYQSTPQKVHTEIYLG
ncbi:MAG TPA: hypothetical protein DD473_07110 [Planctomycetaceae bacterium]|nr:hypothetical protein [Planctomycetaceae bacterium]|tara:strand:- start:210 stop:554 length:345 start_codon:yes stop_codon:yes gene_type:complete